jgi:hypothetical protein
MKGSDTPGLAQKQPDWYSMRPFSLTAPQEPAWATYTLKRALPSGGNGPVSLFKIPNSQCLPDLGV